MYVLVRRHAHQTMLHFARSWHNRKSRMEICVTSLPCRNVNEALMPTNCGCVFATSKILQDSAHVAVRICCTSKILQDSAHVAVRICCLQPVLLTFWIVQGLSQLSFFHLVSRVFYGPFHWEAAVANKPSEGRTHSRLRRC